MKNHTQDDVVHQFCLASYPGWNADSKGLPDHHHLVPTRDGDMVCAFCHYSAAELREAMNTYHAHYDRLLDQNTSKADRDYAATMITVYLKIMQGERR